MNNKSHHHTFAILIMAAIALMLGACATTSAGTQTAQTAENPENTNQVGDIQTAAAVTQFPEIIITANDYTFGVPAQVEAGLVSVTLKNEGQEPHHVQLARLNDGVDIAQFQEALQTGPEAFDLVTWAGGPATVDPGASQTVTVDLTTGTYLLLCFVPDHEGTPHMALGQLASMEVVEPAEPRANVSQPKAGKVVKMLDFSYVLPAEVNAGSQVWEIVNEGDQPHEINLIKLANGKTMDDVAAFMHAPQGAPPFSNAGGLQGIDPGESGWLYLDLTAGTYVALCHIPDPASGHTHEELGMVIPFSVK